MKILVDDGLFAAKEWRADLTALILLVLRKWHHHNLIWTGAEITGRRAWMDWLREGLSEDELVIADLEEDLGRSMRNAADPNEAPFETDDPDQRAGHPNPPPTTDTARPIPHATIRLVASGPPTWEHFPHHPVELTPDLALNVLAHPLEVWVENAINDRRFILHSVRKEDRMWMERWERAGALRFMHAGGKDHIANKAEELRTCSGTHFGVRMRTVLVLDSDRRSPTGKSSAAARSVTRIARDSGFVCKVWDRRCIENYLPRAELKGDLKARGLNVECLRAWDQLSANYPNEAYRNFVNMKDGITHDLKDTSPLTTEERTYWEKLGPELIHQFGSGFGSKLAGAVLDRARHQFALDAEGRSELDCFVLTLKDCL